MQKHGIKADVRQKKRSRKKEQQQYQEDSLLERKFIQIAPNLVWVSDTTELTYGRNNKVRLHVVLALYGRYVLSYHISPTETAEAAIEAVLFTMGESVELSRIAKALEEEEETVRNVIHQMMERYEKEDRGIHIIELDNAFQMCTKKETYEYLIRIAKQPKRHVLTDVALEAL